VTMRACHWLRWGLSALRLAGLGLVALAAAATPLRAADAPADALSAAFKQLAHGDFSAKGAAIATIAASGHPRAAAILEALLEGQLVVVTATGEVALAQTSGAMTRLAEPLTGADAGERPRGEVQPIPINNRLRTAIRGQLGSLTLLSAEPERRRTAADALFRSRDASALALLEQAIAKETATGVKARLERAQAAIEATTPSLPADVRIAAITRLASMPDRDVGSLLTELAANEGDAPVRAAAEAAAEKVEARLALMRALAGLFQGMSLGSVLLLAAVGLAITFGVMGVINMAHGEVMMLGAYTTFVIQEWIRTSAPHLFDYSLAFAIPAAFLVAGATGVLIERGIIRFLYGRPLETLLATWGVSLILQQAVRSVFGPSNREVGNPAWMSGAVEVAGGLTLTYNRLWIIAFAALVFVLLIVIIRHTAFGLQMRAVTQNRRMAASMGIRTGYVDALTFGLGSGIAGIAGVALSQIDNVSPNLGQGYIIDSFMVVVFGGVGNLWGTLVGALSLGMINKLLEPYAGAVLGKILVLVAIILFIQKRPRGLFALKGRAVES
jgi:urea transport system permease protein